jgi:hypothetical protein
MRRSIVRWAAILAALATLAGAATASAGILVGTYAGRITGVEGHRSFKGGNMKFKLSGRGRIKSFQFSKIRVACSNGNLYRTSGHISPNVRVFKHNGVRKFKFHGSNQYGGELKVLGIFRGHDHARGLLRYKGRIPTNDGHVRHCTTFRQFWSASHVR